MAKKKREKSRVSLELEFTNTKKFDVNIDGYRKGRGIGMKLGKVDRENLAKVIKHVLEVVDDLQAKED